MARLAYRHNHDYRERLAVCIQQMADYSETELSPQRAALIRAMRETVRPHQLTYLELYYVRHMNQPEIAARLGRSVSTVSRGIASGEARLRPLMELERNLF